MADVFLSVVPGPVGFNKLAVVKRLRNPDEGSHVEMFLDEARLAARLNHPNIVHTYDVGESNGKYFIAMEYLEGQTLQALVSRLGARSEGLSEMLAAYITAQVLKGLHHAHELCDFDGTPIGVVHRDVSPHNIYITYGGEVKVLDFGIAKAKMNATHTETGVIKGKVRYMAPETVAETDVDRRADIFAAGVVLWESIARRALFHGDPTAIMARVMNEDAPSSRSVRATASMELDRIALKALRRDRNERYATANEMRGELEDFLGDKGVSASEKELARLMNDLFAQMRDEVRARVRTVLGRLPAAGGAPVAAIPDRPSQLPGLLDGTSPRTALASGGSSVVPVGPSASARRWRGLLLAVTGALAAVAMLGRLGHQIGAPSVPVPSAGAAAPAHAHVHLETTPAGALVERDHAPAVLTPAEFDIDPGSRSLRVALDGYETVTLVLDVKPGASIDRAITLRELAPQPVASAPPAPSPHANVPSPVPRSVPAAKQPAPAKAAPVGSQRVKIRVLDDSDPVIAARLPAPRTSGHAGRFGASVLAGALLVLSTGTSRAADPGSPPSAEPPPAERLAEEAYELHAHGRYPEAIATYLKAYEISRAGATLFNIATIYDRKLHERELASDYYRRYLGSPDAEPDLVEKATERLTALKHEAEAIAPVATVPEAPSPTAIVAEVAAPTAIVAEVAAPQSPAPSSAMPAPSQSRTPGPQTTPADLSARRSLWKTTGLVIGSAGLVGIGASLALGLAARNKNDDANALCSDSACTSTRGVTFAQQAGDLATQSTIVFVAGLACVGGGLAMYFAGPGPGAAARLSLLPQLDTRTAEMSVRLGF